MALAVNKTCEFGVVATYWSADQVNIYWDANENKNAHVVLGGYRSESAKKTDGERPVTSFSYDFGNDLPFTKGGNNELEFYEWLKEKAVEEVPEDQVLDEKYALFADAEDV